MSEPLGLVAEPEVRFWSDDFDMDLPKVLPNLDTILGAAAGIRLWTHGGSSFGRLNHPSVWNTYTGEVVAYFGLDAAGTAKPAECYTDHPLVECTWREVVRDAWPHSYTVLIGEEPVWHAGRLADAFQDLMYDLRGWRQLPAGRVEGLKRQVAQDVEAATDRLLALGGSTNE